jgi:hypothetical protein
MKVRYHKALGIGTIVLGIVFIGLAFSTAGSSWSAIPFVMGCFEIWYGILFLRRPYLFLADTKLEVYAIAGNALATYRFQSLKEIEIDHNQLFINQNGKRQKMRVTAWITDESDWQNMLQKIRSAL